MHTRGWLWDELEYTDRVAEPYIDDDDEADVVVDAAAAAVDVHLDADTVYPETQSIEAGLGNDNLKKADHG